ncbi:MAG TPA: Asp23/Gls24 family envelope stress response protein [Amycolatopsis sp.]|nr:Asp23/Gls24 family envelope stress response protein [Amycolatopsis sp.]
MSEVISSFFSRTKNDTIEPDVASTSAESTAADAAAPETLETNATGADAATDIAPAEDGDVTIEVETIDAETAEDADEGAGQDVTEAADEVVVSADEAQSDTVESDEAPAPVAAETRPAAGTRGSTTVGDGVVAKLVSMVARKADGVHDLDDDGVVVAVDGGVATLKVSLVLLFGHTVNTVAEEIRIAVIDAVEQYLGLDVAAVDVNVTDIQLPNAA